MAAVSKALFRGSASTTSTTLYTTPAGSTAVVTNIVINNSSVAGATATLWLDDVDLCTAIPLTSNQVITFDIKQVLATGKTIKGLASATSVDFHISGVEIA